MRCDIKSVSGTRGADRARQRSHSIWTSIAPSDSASTSSATCACSAALYYTTGRQDTGVPENSTSAALYFWGDYPAREHEIAQTRRAKTPIRNHLGLKFRDEIKPKQKRPDHNVTNSRGWPAVLRWDILESSLKIRSTQLAKHRQVPRKASSALPAYIRAGPPPISTATSSTSIRSDSSAPWRRAPSTW